MSYDGSLKFDTSLDASGLQKGANNLKSIVEGLGIFEFLKQGVQMVADSVQAAMSRLDTMDQFNRVMTTLTGSTDEANAALERTNEIVAGTAFGLDTASKGVQAFVASGMEVSKATDTMGAWADAVAFYTKGTNAELETVSSALQKMATKGNVTMEHLQMLLEAGVPAIQIYASAVGKSTEEVTEQMSKGELKTDDFISAMNAAFETGTAGFPSIAGAAKDAGASWSGSIDNMNAAITRGVASILTAFDDMFDVKAGMVQFGKTLETIFKGGAENIETIIPIVTGAVAAFLTFKTVTAVMNTVTGSILGNCRSIKDVFSVLVMGIQDGIKKISTAFQTMSMSTMIGIIISAVVALIGVIDGLSNSIDGWQKKLEESNAKAQEQIQTNESLLDGLREIDTEYEKNIGQTESAAESSRNLLNRITELQAGIQNGTIAAENQAAAQREISQITTQLNSDVENLGLEYNAVTNSLNMTTNAVEAAIEKQKEYQQAIAKMEHASNMYEKQLEVEDEIYMTKARLADKQQELNDLQNGLHLGLNAVEQWDWAKASKETADATEELADQLEELKERQEYVAEASKIQNQEALNAMVDRIRGVNEYKEISNQMTDEEIQNIQKMIDAGGELSDADLQKFKTIQSNRAKEIVAQQDYIQAIKDGNVEITEAEAAAIEQRRVNGEELTEIEQAKLDRWNEIAEEYKQSVADTADDIINSWERLPDEYDLTLDEMMEIGEENAERYGEWSRKMAYLSQYMSEESIAALKELGPGAMSVIDELIVGGSEKMTEFDNMMVGKVQGTAENAVSGLGAITPAVVETFNQLNIGVGLKMDEMGNILDTKTNETIASASQIFNGDELPQAASDALTKTAAAIRDNQETVAASGEKGQASGNQFSTEYGTAVSSSEAPVTGAQAVAEEVTGALSNADYSGITTGIANAIRSGTGTVSAAVSELDSSVQKGLKDMTQKSVLEGANFVMKLAARIRLGKTDVILAIGTVVSGVTQKLNTLIANGESVISQMFAGMRSAVDSAAPSLYRKIDSVCSEIKRRMQNAMQIHSPSKFTKYLFEMLLKGGEVGLDGEKDKLFRKTDQVSAGVLSRIGAIPDGLSDKLSAMISGNQMTVAAAVASGSMASGNYVSVSVSIPITVNGKMTDAEIEAATDKMVYAVRKKIGRLI